MTCFDYMAPIYETVWDKLKQKIIQFELAYETWYARASFSANRKARKDLKDEILAKEISDSED